jgi:CMP-N,N'-diacetyllegionaminic acid synthase
MSQFALIPARGGSKGVPKKNLRLLGGMPLVAHSIVSAREAGMFEDVFVSTDDPDIARVAADFGAIVIDRPAELALDSTPMTPVVEHALGWYERRHSTPSQMFLLQPTSPFRTAQDIRAAASLLSGDADSVLAVYEPPHPPEWAMGLTDAGYLQPYISLPETQTRRQDLSGNYFGGPLFAIETVAFRKYRRFLTERTRFLVVPPARAVDIDTELDFQFAEFLMSHRSNGTHA